MGVKSMDSLTYYKEQLEVVRVIRGIAQRNYAVNPCNKTEVFLEYWINKIKEYEELIAELEGGNDDEK